MEWEYEYTKALDGSILDDMIKLNVELRPKYSRTTVVVDDVVCIFNEALTAEEHDTLNVVIDQYSDTHPLVVRRDIELNHMVPAMSFGMNFLAKFSANNIYLGKTGIQVAALLEAYPDLIHAAITGSREALYYTVATMVPSADISQEEIDEFTLRLKIELGIP